MSKITCPRCLTSVEPEDWADYSCTFCEHTRTVIESEDLDVEDLMWLFDTDIGHSVALDGCILADPDQTCQHGFPSRLTAVGML